MKDFKVLVCIALILGLSLASFAMDKEGRKQPLTKPAQVPPPIVVNVGATGTIVGYTGHCGRNEYPPAFWYTWPDNQYLYNGSFRYLGYVDGVLEAPRTIVSEADTFYWTSKRYDPNAVSTMDTKAEWKALEGLPLEVIQRTYAWAESYRDDFIVWDFTFKNYSDTKTITGFYLGQWMDCDVSSKGGTYHWLDDEVGFYGQWQGKFQVPTRWAKDFIDDPQDSTFITYMWDDDYPATPEEDTGGWYTPKESEGFIGVITIACPPTDDGMFPANQPSGHTWWDWNTDPPDNESLYNYMAWGARHPDQPYRLPPPTPYDYRYFACWGPYDLEPGESIRIVVATGLGIGLEGIVRNLKWAKRLYPDWIGPSAPYPPATFNVVPEVDPIRVEISWSDEPEYETRDAVTGENDFEGYKLWKSEDGGGTWALLAQFDLINDIGPNTGIKHEFIDYAVQVGFDYVYSITSYDRGDPAAGLPSLEGGKLDKLTLARPGTKPLEATKKSMDDIFVAPNPYRAYAPWNPEPGVLIPEIKEYTREENRLIFFNLPKKCTIRIFTLAGDLVDTIEKDDESGMAYWDAICKSNIDIISGIYIYHVQADQGEKIGKFVIVK